MRRDCQIEGNKLVPSPSSLAQVTFLAKPSPEERAWLIDDCGISFHTVDSALDPASEARLEIEDDHIAILLNVPKNYSNDQKLVFGVKTMGIFLVKDRLIVLSPTEHPNIDESSKHHKIDDTLDVVLRIFGGTISHFVGHLRVIHQLSESLENKISSSMANEYLLGMFALEKSLVYYLSAIGSNAVLLEKLKSNARRLNFDEDHLDFLEDLLIDIRQCNRLAEMYSNILTNLMDARGSIVNNNLNVLIKRLTVISVVMMPLNLIASIGGMSEFSAMTQGIPMWISYSGFLGLMLTLGLLTYRILQGLSVDGTKSKKKT